jgi:predicted secreted protein
LPYDEVERKPFKQIEPVSQSKPKLLKDVINHLYEKEKKFVYTKHSVQRDELVNQSDMIFNLDRSTYINTQLKTEIQKSSEADVLSGQQMVIRLHQRKK